MIGMLISRFLFKGRQPVLANSNTFQNGGKSQTEISRVLKQELPRIDYFHQGASAQP